MSRVTVTSLLILVLSSSPCLAAPDVPEGLSAVVSGSPPTVSLTWNAVSGADGYRVYRGQDVVADQMVADDLTLANHVDGEVTQYTTYAYSVSAYDGSGESERSPPILIWCNTGARTVLAEDLTQAAVQAAIDEAVDGDTVVMPEGTATWNASVDIGEQLTWGENPTYESKSMILQGAGMDRTVITEGTINFTGVEDKPFRITGLTLLGTETGSDAGINIGGVSRQYRVDHCRFDLGKRSIWASGEGLIDHCTIIRTSHSQGLAVIGAGDRDWDKPASLGTKKAVFIEDCRFEFDEPYDGALDAYGGARYVFRYNTVWNTHAGHHGRDSGGYRSVNLFEFYNNTFTATGLETGQRSLFFRGGTGVVFDNIWESDGQSWQWYRGIEIANYCSCPQQFEACGWPACTTYPCMDQVGRACDITPPISDPLSYDQLLEPIYEWNNTNNGSDEKIYADDSCAAAIEHMQEGRDFFNDTQRPGYRPYIYPHPLAVQSPPPPQTDFERPTVPSDFHMVQSTETPDRTATLAWEASTDTGGSGMAGYYLWLNGKRVTSNSDPDSTRYTFLGLRPMEYAFQVSAFDEAGNESEPTEPVTVTFASQEESPQDESSGCGCNDGGRPEGLLLILFVVMWLAGHALLRRAGRRSPNV